MTTRDREKGSSLVKIAAFIAVVALVCFVGWYIVSSNKQDNKVSKTSPTQKHKETQPADPTSDWKSYTSDEGKYSLKYPNTWVVASNPELCSPGLLLLGPTKDSAGKCGSDSVGQITVSSFTTESGPMGLTEDYYSNIKVDSATTADGVKGERQSGTYTYEGDGVGLTEGTKVVMYIFKNHDTFYKVNYYQTPAYPDVTKEFDLIVTKTLKFN